NTLIGIKPKNIQGNLFEDPQIDVTKHELLQTRHKHFLANTPKDKKGCRAEDERLRNKLAMLLEKNNMFAQENAEQLANWNPYNQNSISPFFDPEWMFGLKEGFDIVIGNPPYVQLQNNDGELAKLHEKCGYKTFARTGDLYCLFYERGYQLLKPLGRLCFITSNKWMRAGYGESSRKFLTENTNPEQLIDFAGVKVFESATVDTNILMFAKDKNRQQTQACIVKKEGIKDLSVYIRQSSSIINALSVCV
ncbi:Type IIS restriction enzyme Eco57I, partial [termite gut metagenome]